MRSTWPSRGVLLSARSQLAERKQIIDRLRPRLLSFGLPVEDLKEILTRLALTEIGVLRQIEAKGIDEIKKAIKKATEKPQP